MYHIPWNDRWDADAVNTRLRDQGLPSRVEGNNLVIEFVEPRPSWRHPLRRIQGMFRRPPRTELVYNPDQIINRVSLWWFSSAPLHLIKEPLEATMRELGYLSVGEEITEREIVLNCCTPSNKLLRKLAALEQLDDARDSGTYGSDNDYCLSREKFLVEIEQMIIDSDDFADPDFSPSIGAFRH